MAFDGQGPLFRRGSGTTTPYEDRLEFEDIEFNAKIRHIACDKGMTISEGVLFTSQHKVEVEDTRYLELRKFSAIDMESGLLRRRAKKKGRSVQVVRAFADRAEHFQESRQATKELNRSRAIQCLAKILLEY